MGMGVVRAASSGHTGLLGILPNVRSPVAQPLAVLGSESHGAHTWLQSESSGFHFLVKFSPAHGTLTNS